MPLQHHLTSFCGEEQQFCSELPSNGRAAHLISKAEPVITMAENHFSCLYLGSHLDPYLVTVVELNPGWTSKTGVSRFGSAAPLIKKEQRNHWTLLQSRTMASEADSHPGRLHSATNHWKLWLEGTNRPSSPAEVHKKPEASYSTSVPWTSRSKYHSQQLTAILLLFYLYLFILSVWNFLPRLEQVSVHKPWQEL